MYFLRGYIKMIVYFCFINESSFYGGNIKYFLGFEL